MQSPFCFNSLYHSNTLPHLAMYYSNAFIVRRNMKERVKNRFGESGIDDAIMIFLSLVSVFLLFFEILAEHTPQQAYALEIADISIASIFLLEFSIRLIRAPNRAVFLRRHWWELLASIPITSDATQILRTFNLLRIFRLIRLLRLIRFLARLKIILDTSSRFVEQTHLIYIAALGGIVIMSGALGFHYMEAGSNPNVHSLWDSFWWTVVTITTVGYGDIYPVTTGGRILAIFLMLGGIGTFSAVTAVIAAHLVRKREEV